MRKILLSFLSVIVSLSAFAGSYTITFKDSGTTTDKTSALTTSSKLSDLTESSYVSFIKATNNTYIGKQNTGLKFSSSSKNGSITFTLDASGVCKPTSIVVNAARWKSTEVAKVAVNGAAAQEIESDAFADLTFSFDGSTEITELKIDATKRIYVHSVTVNFDGAGEVTTARPEISVEGENTIVMTSPDGGSIYYTLDETDPTETSTLYAGPIPFTTRTVVKAIAVANGKASESTTYIALPNVIDNLADFVTNANTAVTKVNAPVTAIYQNGRNLYIKDANDNFILAYNDKDLASVAGQFTNNGDEISYISGTFKLQAQLPELLVTEVGEKSAGTPVDPYEVNISDIDATMLNQYVTFGPVNIVDAASGKANNYDVTDADGGSILMYNPFYNATYYDVVEVPTGEGFTVTGFVSTYNSTLQITPVLIEGGVVMEKVEAPVFTPESGALAEGDLITITSATEGASIYYTTEDVTPTADNAFLYSEPIPFTEAVTIKAIAIKDGMIDSDVTTASYTLKVAGAMTATFDFHNTETTLAQATDKTLTVPEDGKGTSVKDQSFVADAITLTVSQGTNTSNPPMWWNYTPTATAPNERGCELRLYANEDVTVSAATGYKINKIVITLNAGSTTFGTQTVTCEGGEGTWTNNTKTWAATSGDVTSVKFMAGGSSRYGQFTVEYVATTLGAIDSVISDADADAPAEYFNLQGIRVNADNLTPGIYVLRQGNKVSKVLVK